MKGNTFVFALVGALIVIFPAVLTGVLLVNTSLLSFLHGGVLSPQERQLLFDQSERLDSLVLEIERMDSLSEKMEATVLKEQSVLKMLDRPSASVDDVFAPGLLPDNIAARPDKDPVYIGRLVSGTLSQRFQPSNSHYGIDIATPVNEPVSALSDGSVIFSGWTTDFGYTLILDHGTYKTFYKHCSRLFKRSHEQVKLGEIIALSGNTGKFSTGTHLHFEIWRNGIPVNPELYLRK
ncbi:MAG: M23 family metallopeptidase [Chlorobium phaeobacteroides]|nr:M23 family metallopeptidase [Chlorobium phaeobacteroides]